MEFKTVLSKIKTRYQSEILTFEKMKFLGNTKSKITKKENRENATHLKITELVLVYFSSVNSDYQHDSRGLSTFIPNQSCG